MYSGSIQTVYVEYDSGYGAVFNYYGGNVKSLLVSTNTAGTPYDSVELDGSSSQVYTYVGGIDPVQE